MVYTRLSLIFLLLFVGPAYSQQQSDPKFLESAIAALQAQRNRALDEAASAEAQLTKAQQELADLKKQLESPKPKE